MRRHPNLEMTSSAIIAFGCTFLIGCSDGSSTTSDPPLMFET